MRILLTLLILAGAALSADLSVLRDFFSRAGYVVEVMEGEVVLDLGKGSAFSGEVFTVLREGRELVHPRTGEKLGTVERRIGSVEITEVRESFSIARVLEGEGIERGDRVKLRAGEVCFAGSDEGFYRISSLVEDLRRGEGCDYVIRELENGYGVEYRGKAVAFFEKGTAEVKEPEEFRLKARFVMALPHLPLSADACDLSGRGEKHLVVLFEESLRIYELLKEELVEFATLRLPSGYPISVQCVDFGEGKDLILINMVVSGSASSLVAEVRDGAPVVVEEGIPFLMAVLDERKPGESFVGQRFNSRDLWGEVRKLSYRNGEVTAGEELDVPSGFRVDSAVARDDLLIFVDGDGFLRVFRGEDLLFSREGFSGSYTTAELPGTYEEDDKHTFNPRVTPLTFNGEEYFAVIRNMSSPVHRFLDVTKFSEGEIYLLRVDRRVTFKKVEGKKFEEAIQAVVFTEEGRIFVITGRTGTLPLQNTGSIFEVSVEAL